jgi:hypothetical protein
MIRLTIEPTLLIAALALGCGLLAVALAALQWRVAGRPRRRCAALEAGSRALRLDVDNADSRIVHAESKAKRTLLDCSLLAERMTALESRAESPSFDQAIDSARRGAEPDKLAQRFGLSRGEADLVTRLHGRTKNP